jgi:hypothetical protein
VVPPETASFHNPALSSSKTQLLLHIPFTPGSIETLIYNIKQKKVKHNWCRGAVAGFTPEMLKNQTAH